MHFKLLIIASALFSTTFALPVGQWLSNDQLSERETLEFFPRTRSNQQPVIPGVTVPAPGQRKYYGVQPQPILIQSIIKPKVDTLPTPKTTICNHHNSVMNRQTHSVCLMSPSGISDNHKAGRPMASKLTTRLRFSAGVVVGYSGGKLSRSSII